MIFFGEESKAGRRPDARPDQPPSAGPEWSDAIAPDGAASEGSEAAQADAPTPEPVFAAPAGRAVIKVIGLGGGGGNAVNRMIEAGVQGVDFIAANTDAQDLTRSKAPVRLQLGVQRTGGLGAGGDPEIGRAAAHDNLDEIIDVLSGADMVFIALGEGGGTGTGAAPIVACAVKELPALSIAVVTKPFTVEGPRRRDVADDGTRELREYVDTLICVPNDRVAEVYGDKPIRAAFWDADDVVRQAVQGISDLIQTPGEINLDFADIRTAMRARGDAVLGIGSAVGENRAEDATRAAISSPLLEDTSVEGATSIIVNVTGGESLTLNEMQRAVEVVREVCGAGYAPRLRPADEAGDNIIVGMALDPSMDDTPEGNQVKVTVVATGFPDRARTGTPHDLTQFTKGSEDQPMPLFDETDETVATEGVERWGDLETPGFLKKRQG